MINKDFFNSLKIKYDDSESERRQIISGSNKILHDSKRVIFSLHRGDFEKARQSLINLEKSLQNLDSKFGHDRLIKEGAYKAGVEEFVEARLFYNIFSGAGVAPIEGLNIETESYIGGISDLTGELVRLATNLAAKERFAEVERIKKIINDILNELIDFDFTGYQRTKYDQAKNNLKKIEQMSYEINLRQT